ncbi:hypothetical protein CKO_00576 [Citrobacter koseri ATCC BAA-895]|uniref:Uncharacterized protein n=1 Tax=Citrobacter koseri (strain ATCC BAA-895 / CDC 4225-83 / SGSC4696) TaxID=290338 RepID=A8AE16_CITK8|nr:hypothetical protein CKO_00576 [Citrobacter koseri ATCC BAA-895]
MRCPLAGQRDAPYFVSRDIQRLVRGEDDDPALLCMFSHALCQALNAIDINGGKRLVEDPERRAGQPQTRQCHAPLLSSGKLVDGDVFVSGQPRLRQRGQTLRRIAVMVEKAQVLQRRKPGFNPRLMSNPQQILMVAVAHAVQRLLLPAHFPCVGARQPGEQPQKGGFPRAVAPGNLYPFPCVHAKRQPTEQYSVIPLAEQFSGFKHTHSLLKARFHFAHIREFMRNPFVAVDTGLPLFHCLVVHFGGNAFLSGEIHKFEVVAVTALPRIGVFHPSPLALRHCQTVIFKLLRSIDNAEHLPVQLFTGLDLTDHFRAPLVRNVTVRTGGANAAAVVVVHGFHVFLIDGVAHFVAADTELFGVGLFHPGVETAPENNAANKTD